MNTGIFRKFRDFALKGNVIDMAVGVIIGGAFGKIVTSLVNDILNPVFAFVLGKADLSDLKLVIRAADEAKGVSEAAIAYGAFLQNVIDFFIIALSIFLFIQLVTTAGRKAMSLAARKKTAADAPVPEAPAAPAVSDEAAILAEIRDLLKSNSQEK